MAGRGGVLLFLLVLSAGPATSQTAEPGAEVGMADQETSGHAVIVDVARLAEPGFVVVHDETLGEGQGIGSIRGASRVLPPGLHFDVLVRIDPPLERDQTVTAMLHVDSNDNGVFDLVRTEADDGPYLLGSALVVDEARIDVLDDRNTPFASVLAVLGSALAALLVRSRGR